MGQVESEQDASDTSAEVEDVSQSKKKGLNLRPLLRLAQRQILVIAAIALAVSVVNGVTVIRRPRSYIGTFRLLVEPVTSEAKLTAPLLLSRSNEGAIPNDSLGLDYPTQLEILQSPEMMSAILKDIRSSYPELNALKLQKGLKILRLGGTSQSTQTKILEISYQSSDPQQIEFVLQKISEKYLKYSLDERKTRIGEGVKFIEDQLPALQTRIERLRGQLQQLQQRYKVIDPAAQGEQLLTQIRQLAALQIEVKRLLQEQQSNYLNLQNQLQLTPAQAIAASVLTNDPNYNRLLSKVRELEDQIALESTRFLPSTPILQALNDKQQQLLPRLRQEAEAALGPNLAMEADNPQVLAFQDSTRTKLIQEYIDTANQIQTLQVRDQAIAQIKSQLERDVQQFPVITNQYTELQRQLSISIRTLDQLLTERETLRVQAAQNQVPWEVLSKPMVPRDPTGRPIADGGGSSKRLMMGTFAGLALGLGVAIALDKRRDIFYSQEDIQDSLPLPCLGKIPPPADVGLLNESFPRLPFLLPGISPPDPPPADETTVNPSADPIAEAYSLLYTNLRFLFADAPIRSLVVSSPLPGDGKSTVAIHLAETAAAMGQRVLLVDGNLRSPQLQSRLDLPEFKGLSELLRGGLAPEDVVQQAPHLDSLAILTAGHPLPDSSKRFASPQMKTLMQALEATFDLVIYDAPHLLDVTDTTFLAANTDGILLVVAVALTPCSVTHKVLQGLAAYQLSCLGTVAVQHP